MSNKELYDKIMKLLWKHEPQAADACHAALWDALGLPSRESSSESSDPNEIEPFSLDLREERLRE